MVGRVPLSVWINDYTNFNAVAPVLNTELGNFPYRSPDSSDAQGLEGPPTHHTPQAKGFTLGHPCASFIHSATSAPRFSFLPQRRTSSASIDIFPCEYRVISCSTLILSAPTVRMPREGRWHQKTSSHGAMATARIRRLRLFTVLGWPRRRESTPLSCKFYIDLGDAFRFNPGRQHLRQLVPFLHSSSKMSNSSLASLCSSGNIPNPTLFGAEILSLTSNLVSNYSTYVPDTYNYNHPSVSVDNVDYCNITVTYTHPGQNDKINVEAWLPLEWNERLMAVGGGGLVAGRFVLSYFFMAGAIGEGYAAVTTDAGTSTDPATGLTELLLEPGNIDWNAVQNFGSRALNDEVITILSTSPALEIKPMRTNNDSPSSQRTWSRASTAASPSTRTGAAAPRAADRA